MLYILLSLIVLLPVFIGFGKFAELYTGILFSGISGKLFLGTLFLGTLFCFLAFFIPLNLYLEVLMVLMGIGLCIYFKQHLAVYAFLKANKFGFGILTGTILFFGSFPPFILDHFGYYTPTISWLSQFGLTKGIANLDLLLGQMSFWHILQAGFSNFSDPFLRLNAVFLIFYAIYILEKKSWLHLIFFPILLLFAQSPSPDLPVIILSLIILNEILTGNKNAAVLFATALFVFAIKPTMLWAPILALLYSLIILKISIKKLVPALIVLGIFILKNLWTFGYPIFPLSLLDFHLSWKPNAALLATSSEVALQKTYDMQYTLKEISNFSGWEYVTKWLFLPGIKGVIHLLFISSLVIFTIYACYMRTKVVYIIWASIFLKSALVLLFSAQYRFFIEVLFVILFVMFYKKKSRILLFYIAGAGIAATLLIFSFPRLLQKAIPSFKLGNYLSGFAREQIIRPTTYTLKNHTAHTLGNLKFNVVKDYPYTFDTPMPAISPSFLKEYSDAGIFPQKSGAEYSDGFVWKKLTSQEHQELKLILKDLGY